MSDWFHKVNKQPLQLTAGPLRFYSPQPSLDGKKIYAIGEQPRSELVRYDTKTGPFVSYLGGISARNVSFSRDGKWVSYVSYPEGNLWRCRIDGSEKLQLTPTQLGVMSARWSPNSRQIALTATSAGKAERLYLVASDGGELRELSVAKFNAVNASWGDDQNSVTFNDAFGPGHATGPSTSRQW